MLANIKPYIGSWTIKWISGANPQVQPNWTLLIGTGSANGDTAPELSDDYDVIVGFAVLDDSGVCRLSSSSDANQPLPMLFSNGTLRTVGTSEHLPVRIYLSMALAELPDGGNYPSIYGSTVSGDPDQVGVWGADANPPMQPPPNVSTATS